MAIGEENAIICWNCKYIAKCRPNARPKKSCKYFEPLGTLVSQTRIGAWLGMDRKQVVDLMTEFGTDKIVELLATHGRNLRYEIVNTYTRFYYMGRDGKDAEK